MSLVGKSTQQFRFLAPLGEGGHGHVYAGYDEKLDRRVALKVLHRDQRLKPQAKARLLREARILSQLDHPHICRIYDLIEGVDHDFLVLELIEGKSLKQALRDGDLKPADKMRVAEQIADALVAAHGRGIIHRDLKPGNVMLTPEGDVKILDFGIARLLNEEIGPQLDDLETVADDKTTADFNRDPEASVPRTETGSVLGTPAYMSPEQIKGEVTTSASDMYSFGLILQELFTGRSAFDFKLPKAMLLVKVALAETRPITGIDGDLAALIKRLQSPEPAARPAAVDTAERLRWIRDKPRRIRRRWLTLAAMAFLVLTAAILAFQAVRIGSERDRANREAATAREVQRFLVDLFRQSDPQDPTGRRMTAEQLLQRGAERINSELADRPLVQAKIMDTIGRVQVNLGLIDDADPLLTRALSIRRREPGAEPLEIAESLTSVGILRRWQERYAEAEEAHLEALAIRRRQLPADDPLIARSLAELGIVYWFQGHLRQSMQALEEARAMIERRFGPGDERLIEVLHRLSYAYLYLGRFADAERVFHRVLELRQRFRDPYDAGTAYTLHGLGMVYEYLGRFADAEEYVRRSLDIRETALDPHHRLVAWSLAELGRIYNQEGRQAEAEAVLRRALDIESVAGSSRATCLSNLAAVLTNDGRLEEAEPMHREALKLITEHVPEHVVVAEIRNDFGDHLRRAGRLDEAETQYRLALEQLRAIDPEHPMTAQPLNGLGALYLARGQPVVAAGFYRQALAVGRQNGHELASTAHSHCGLAAAAARLGDAAEAAEERRLGVERWRQMGLAEHPHAVACGG
ncbi:MAG: hypothetical protein D6696_09090 [Acidobacteria bacterium]|nr:MAG: hypothetical protein D6696_09090 [Acidobacteriota bacterium]